MTPPSDWTEYKHEDCEVCGHRGWCTHTEDDRGLLVMCMRPEASAHPGLVYQKIIADGSCAYFVRPDGDGEPGGEKVGRTSPNGKGNGHRPAADAATRSGAYDALLDVLGLSAGHRAQLERRGLSGADIDAGRYQTLPDDGRDRLAAKVRERSGLDSAALLEVPGFVKNDSGLLEVAGRAGLVIPVMDPGGKIGGCQLRPDDPGKGGKYVWLTSAPWGGPSAVASAHVPPGAAGEHGMVRLTEGPLKAHIATAMSGIPTVGIAGCGAWRRALPVLEALGAKTVRLAYDADYRRNPTVCGGLCNATRGLVAAGYAVELEWWDASLGKGIDDVLAAGGKTSVSTSAVEPTAIQLVLGAAKKVGIAPAPADPDQVVPWAEFYLSRKLGPDLSRDIELMVAAGRLGKTDPRRTQLTATLKKYPKVVRASEWLRTCRDLAEREKPKAGDGYVEKDGRIVVMVATAEGLEANPLCDFTARIVREVERHEAGGVRLRFVIDATHRDGFEASIEVDADRYAKMEWPEALGSIFRVHSGRGIRDQLREAVQLLSHREPVPRVKVFTSLGWHEHDGKPIYCHAGGVIGADGPVPGVEVAVPSQLSAYRLPEPDPATLQAAFDAHQMLGDFGTGDTKGARGVRAVLRAVPWRAALGPLNSVVHLGGQSGSRKTSVSQVAIQHFAADVKGRIHVPPESWRSTDNALQGVLHHAKDSLLLIDDLKETRDIEKAERVIQSVGDGKGRSRMGRDQALKECLSPRGSVISSGEVDVQTPSTLGRSIVLELSAGDVDLDVLTRVQEAADAGLYASLMASYVEDMAGRRAEMLAEHRGLMADSRGKIRPLPGTHPRHVEAIVDLYASYRLFLRWAVGKGLVAEAEAKGQVAAMRKDLVELCGSQAGPQEESKPGRRYLDAIASALSSGKAHLDNLDSRDVPASYPEACGWTWDPTLRNGLGGHRIPHGSRCVGHIGQSEGFLYLDPIEGRRIVEEIHRAEKHPQSLANIGRELVQEGLITPDKEGKSAIQKKIHGVKMRRFQVPIATFFDGVFEDPEAPKPPAPKATDDEATPF
jgi:hypothetical protein